MSWMARGAWEKPRDSRWRGRKSRPQESDLSLPEVDSPLALPSACFDRRGRLLTRPEQLTARFSALSLFSLFTLPHSHFKQPTNKLSFSRPLSKRSIFASVSTLSLPQTPTWLEFQALNHTLNLHNKNINSALTQQALTMSNTSSHLNPF
jgi:hypothetical protein